MTGEDIKKKVERYLESKFDDELILDGIQEMLNWMGEMNYVEGIIDLNAEADTFYDLPDDLIRVVKVEKPEENIYYYNYLIDAGSIRFKDSGDYKIFAKRHPKINSINDDLNLHLMLENAVIKYVKGFCKLQVNDSSQDGARLEKEAKEDAARAYQMLKRNKRSISKVTVKRHA